MPYSSGAIGSGGVSSVNDKTGKVIIVKDDLELGNADNTADVDKPISNLTQEALDGKAPLVRTISDIITNGLLRRYLFAGDATDSVGGYTGTWTGSERYTKDYQLGVLGAHFNGSSYISVADTELPSATNARTICFWAQVLTSTTPTYQAVVDYGNNTVYSRFGVGQWGMNWMVMTRAGTSTTGVTSAVRNLGLLQHVCVTFDGVMITISINGVDIASGTESSMLTTTLTGTAYIGCDCSATYKSCLWLYDLRFYNRVLSGSEKVTIYEFKG